MANIGKTVKSVAACGNPNRYGSRDVVRMQQGSSKMKKILDGDETEETEEERHLKTLVKLQTKTDLTVADHFSHHREFTPAMSHAPAVEKLVGVHKISHYRQVESLDMQIEELRHCGLNDEEIAIKLAEDMKNEVDAKTTGYGEDPTVRLDRLREINEKVKAYSVRLSCPDSLRGALELNRQERDIELSLKQKRLAGSDLPEFIITKKKFSYTHPDDPVNHISDMMSKIEGKVEREPRRERRRKRKFERRMQYYESFKDDEKEYSETNKETEHSENIDNLVQNLSTQIDEQRKEENDVLEPSSSKVDTSKDHAIREISTSLSFLTKEDILTQRISLEEIKKMDKFKNYEAGEPNKIVYVKNLPSNTKEEDLLSVFGLFNCPDRAKLTFRLLTGRMKGQAFVTFPDEEIAEKAIDLINGYTLKGRPMILSYGRKKC